MAAGKATAIHTADHSDDSTSKDAAGRRVSKACDRCRLKKSKCDGRKPCSRCKADNQLCLFGERKRLKEKVYPKGYVELLEYQQSLLVKAVQQLYQQQWAGSSLQESKGAPLVHDILSSMGLLDDEDGMLDAFLSFEGFTFEEDPIKMQNHLANVEANGKRPSTSSISSDLPSVSSSHSAATNSPVGPFTPQDGMYVPTQQRFQPTSSSSHLLDTGLSFLSRDSPYLLDQSTGLLSSQQSYASDGKYPQHSNIDAKTQAAIAFLRNKQRQKEITHDIYNIYPFPNTFAEPMKPVESTEPAVEDDSFQDFMNLSTPLEWHEREASR